MALQWQVLRNTQHKHYYLCHYKSKAAGSDCLSQSLLRFKSGCEVDVEAWCSCAVEELSKLALPENTLILRALTSSETTVTESTGLDRLGARLQEELKIHYEPHLLSKSKITRPLKQLSKTERHTELANTYQFPTLFNIEWSTILILDDILTTGSTLRAITAAIQQKIPKIRIRGSRWPSQKEQHPSILNLLFKAMPINGNSPEAGSCRKLTPTTSPSNP